MIRFERVSKRYPGIHPQATLLFAAGLGYIAAWISTGIVRQPGKPG